MRIKEEDVPFYDLFPCHPLERKISIWGAIFRDPIHMWKKHYYKSDQAKSKQRKKFLHRLFSRKTMSRYGH